MASEKTPPIFRPRRNQKKLDLRPAIWSLQNHPEEWEKTQFVMRHKPSGVDIWIANDWDSVRVYEGQGKNLRVGVWDRHCFWKAFQKWKRDAGILKKTVSANNAAFARCFSCTNDGEIKLEDGEVIYRGNFPVNGDAIFAYMTAQRLAAE